MINETVRKAIESRSRMLSNRYYFLDYEDLLHDGIYHLMGFELQKGEGQDETLLLKVINNFFSGVSKKAEVRRRRTVNESSFDIPPDTSIDTENIEDTIYKEQITYSLRKIVDGIDQNILTMAQSGHNINEMSKELGMGRQSIIDRLNVIVEKRGELEER